jgi:hypothetical protein
MIDSLLKHSSDPIKIFVLNTGEELFSIKNADVNNWRDIANDDLRKAKSNRTQQEFNWTCASWFMNYLMQYSPSHLVSDGLMEDVQGLNSITYIDADVMFFSDPKVIFDEIGDKDIGIIPHRWEKKLKERLEVNGKYNVSWVTIKNAETGKKCLEKWSNQCID